MPIALQELPFFADSFEILNDSILIFNGAAFEDQVVLWDYRNKKRINSYLKYTPHYNCRPLKPLPNAIMKYYGSENLNKCYTELQSKN